MVSGDKVGGKGKNEPRQEVVVRPYDAPPGPFMGPPSVSSYPFVCSSIERDGDRPTSLRTGEGHWVGFSSVVGSELGRRRGGGGGRREDEPSINH